MNYARNTKIVRKHFLDHQGKSVYCSAFLSIIPLCKTCFFFFNEGYFCSRSFQNNQGLLWRIQGLFEDIHQFFNFQGLFKNMMLFQGLFKTCVNHGVGRRSGKINQ